MKSIYSTSAYREALRGQIQLWKSHEAKRTLTVLAKNAGLQLSYLSNVLNDRAHLSSDQVYALARETGCDAAETDYLLLLLEHERTGITARRKELERTIRNLQAEQLSTKKHLKAETLEMSLEDQARYYLDPFHQLIHLFLSMRPGTTSVQLGQEFGLSPAHVARVLQFLERVGIVTAKKAGFAANTPVSYLPHESPITVAHLQQMRVKALDQIQRLLPSQRYAFSVTITADHEARLKIEREFSKFIQTVEKIVTAAPSEHLYQLNFDLFPWQVLSARERQE